MIHHISVFVYYIQFLPSIRAAESKINKEGDKKILLNKQKKIKTRLRKINSGRVKKVQKS